MQAWTTTIATDRSDQGSPQADAEGRYEFRVFAPDLAREAGVLAAVAGVVGDVEAMLDHYVLGAGAAEASAKLRDAAIELKALVATCGGLERWRPVARVALPACGREVAGLLVRAGICRAPEQDFADTGELSAWLTDCGGVSIVRVRKCRRKFRWRTALAEHSRLTIGNRRLSTIAVEGSLPCEVRRLVDRLGLRVSENTSYPCLLRAMGSG